MRSSFFGLNTLLRALQAQQQALETTNQNIANANTEGYSRQTVRLAPSTPYMAPAGNKPLSTGLHMGTGVVVEEIRRQRDAFVDLELRQQSQAHARWDTVATGLQEVEAIYGDLGDSGLRSLVSKFFNAWSDLSNTPQSGAARAAVRSAGESLAQRFNQLGAQLQSARQEASTRLAIKIGEVNDLSSQIAVLNDQIIRSRGAGDAPNDLMDRRDLLVDRLVVLTGATFREDASGGLTASIGGRTLVSGIQATPLLVEARALPSGTTVHDVKWPSDRQLVGIEGGELGGLLELRDVHLPARQRQIDLLASTIATNVNTVHRGGFGTGQHADRISNFFDPNTTAPLAQTGLAADLTRGTITIGGTSVTVSPSTQSLDALMTQITNAINVSPGVTGPASWSLDAGTGRITITYQGTTAVKLGSTADTSNFLELAGLRGAPDAVTNTATNDRAISGQSPVALVGAAQLKLDQAIKNDLQAIAAAAGASSGLTAATGPGDNRNALAMAALQRAAFGALDGLDFENYYATSVADLGAVSRQAGETAATYELMTDHLEARRESFSGVSLDEEATQLIRYQRAYQAAARGISAMDEMLETLIVRMGRVGN